MTDKSDSASDDEKSSSPSSSTVGLANYNRQKFIRQSSEEIDDDPTNLFSILTIFYLNIIHKIFPIGFGNQSPENSRTSGGSETGAPPSDDHESADVDNNLGLSFDDVIMSPVHELLSPQLTLDQCLKLFAGVKNFSFYLKH